MTPAGMRWIVVVFASWKANLGANTLRCEGQGVRPPGRAPGRGRIGREADAVGGAESLTVSDRRRSRGFRRARAAGTPWVTARSARPAHWKPRSVHCTASPPLVARAFRVAAAISDSFAFEVTTCHRPCATPRGARSGIDARGDGYRPTEATDHRVPRPYVRVTPQLETVS